MSRLSLSLIVGFLVVSPAGAAIRLEADLSERTLRVIEDESLLTSYDVSIGKDEKPTPVGTFSIRKMIWNPRWVPPDEKWAKGKTPKEPGHPDNPMKVVKIFFKEPDYYIHGTEEIDSLGRSGSHGCIRMAPDDVTDLARLLMKHGGKPQPEPWYRSILRSRSAKLIRLETGIRMRIEK